MANSYGKPFITGDATVMWGHLHKLDTKFGDGNHNITVALTDDLKELLASSISDNGWKASKINGMSTNKEGVEVLKVKNSQFARKGISVFTCVDGNAKPTKASPFGNDVVRLRLVPCSLERDNSVSFYLEACQIIEKQPYDSTESSGFETVEGAYDGSDAEVQEEQISSSVAAEDITPEAEDVDLPF